MFLPIQILYVRNLTIFSGPNLTPYPFLVRLFVGMHIPYHWEIFSPYPSNRPLSPPTGLPPSQIFPTITVPSG